MTKYAGKYEALRSYLRTQSAARLPMTFDEIQDRLGERLPKSAKMYRTWWSNDASHHVQANAWLDAGYHTTQVDMTNYRLVFARSPELRGMAEEAKMFDSDSISESDVHPMVGALKGTFTIEPGWDLTKPALDPEEWAEWEASLDRKADMIAKGMFSKP